jgi:hypothetical protein
MVLKATGAPAIVGNRLGRRHRVGFLGLLVTLLVHPCTLGL